MNDRNLSGSGRPVSALTRGSAVAKKWRAMPRFQVGQKVKFRPSHNKALVLNGTIKSVGEKDPDWLTIAATADGKAVLVERDFETRAEDCTEAD
jgi:hypothetical protein